MIAEHTRGSPDKNDLSRKEAKDYFKVEAGSHMRGQIQHFLFNVTGLEDRARNTCECL